LTNDKSFMTVMLMGFSTFPSAKSMKRCLYLILI
jgi:hypothetical protein